MAALMAGACSTAGGRFVVPSGAGSPAPEAGRVFAAVVARCADTRSITAEATLAGRIGGRRARGRLILGSAAGSRLRVEALAPFGAPIFVLAADGISTTLLLPREDRVLTGASVADLLGALTGLRLEAADVHAMLTGCGVEEGEVTGASRHGDTLLAVRLGGDTAWIRERPGPPRVVAAQVGGVTVEYPDDTPFPPTNIRLTAQPASSASGVDIVLRLSQIETNASLPDDAFTVDVPVHARPMTIEELHAAGLLGQIVSAAASPGLAPPAEP